MGNLADLDAYLEHLCAALGHAELPAVFPSEKVHGFVLRDACRYFEFRVGSLDEREERMRIECEARRPMIGQTKTWRNKKSQCKRRVAGVGNQ